MTLESIKTFVSGYLQSLTEETRDDRRGPRYGFEQIILQLAQEADWIPLRLSFHRGGPDASSKPKKEHEYGVDQKFITRDGKLMIVFVLKDEPLTYRNWESHKFNSDMSFACNQNMSEQGLERVEEVKIILGYNKGEEARGLEAFEKFVGSQRDYIGKAKLTIERWNLDKLTDLVLEKLLKSPAILPERFFRKFSYICGQVNDFSHGSPQWEEVLIPDWIEFIDLVLAGPVSVQSLRLISISLLVLHSHGKQEPSFATGWIELLEYAVIAVWKVTRKTTDKKVLSVVMEIWLHLYVHSLEAYYQRNSPLLQTEHSLAFGVRGDFAEATSVFYCYWHMARLGILATSFYELAVTLPEEKCKDLNIGFNTVVNWLVGLINANPAIRRPLLDIHHIQLFLVWQVMRCAGRATEVFTVYQDIFERLLHRRVGGGGVRVIDQSNSWQNLFDYMVTGEEPSEGFGKSSYLLQMLIEIATGGIGPNGPVLAQQIYRHLIEGVDSNGEPYGFAEEVELQSWIPPKEWADKVLQGPVHRTGIALSVKSYYQPNETDRSDFKARVESFVSETRATHPFTEPERIPGSVLFLASILHNSPIPPEFWRKQIFDSPRSSQEPLAKKQQRPTTAKKQPTKAKRKIKKK